MKCNVGQKLEMTTVNSCMYLHPVGNGNTLAVKCRSLLEVNIAFSPPARTLFPGKCYQIDDLYWVEMIFSAEGNMNLINNLGISSFSENHVESEVEHITWNLYVSVCVYMCVCV